MELLAISVPWTMNIAISNYYKLLQVKRDMLKNESLRIIWGYDQCGWRYAQWIGGTGKLFCRKIADFRSGNLNLPERTGS